MHLCRGDDVLWRGLIEAKAHIVFHKVLMIIQGQVDAHLVVAVTLVEVFG